MKQYLMCGIVLFAPWRRAGKVPFHVKQMPDGLFLWGLVTMAKGEALGRKFKKAKEEVGDKTERIAAQIAPYF